MEEEYQNYEVDKIAKSFLTLQSCMVEVMKKEGGNGYKIPHMNKQRRLDEGRLLIALSCDGDLVADNGPYSPSRARCIEKGIEKN